MPMADIPFPSQASSGNWSFEIIGLASATASITKKFIRYESPPFHVCGTINGRACLVDCCVRIQIGVPPPSASNCGHPGKKPVAKRITAPTNVQAAVLFSLEINEAFGHVHRSQTDPHGVAHVNSLRAPDHHAFSRKFQQTDVGAFGRRARNDAIEPFANAPAQQAVWSL